MRTVLLLFFVLFISILGPRSFAFNENCRPFVSSDGMSKGTACRDASGRLVIKTTDHVPVENIRTVPQANAAQPDLTETSETIQNTSNSVKQPSIYDDTKIDERKKVASIPKQTIETEPSELRSKSNSLKDDRAWFTHPAALYVFFSGLIFLPIIRPPFSQWYR